MSARETEMERETLLRLHVGAFFSVAHPDAIFLRGRWHLDVLQRSCLLIIAEFAAFDCTLLRRGYFREKSGKLQRATEILHRATEILTLQQTVMES